MRLKHNSAYSAPILLGLLAGTLLSAAEDRVLVPVDARRTTALRGYVHPLARAQYDQGPANASLEIDNVTLMLKPTDAQQTALDRLLADQRNPSSPNYRKWLTPEQYADRFGLTANDAAKVADWLRSQGLQVHGVARGRRWITFSGTAERAGAAFRTEIHRYQVNGESHFANATEPSVPSALAGVVAGVLGLNDFSWAPAHTQPAAPDFTSASGNHYLAPDDLATIYDISPLYGASIDGTGQSLVIVGRTDVDLADIRLFRSRFKLPANDPQLVLVGRDPGTNSGDLVEADADLEWSGAVARNATIFYVYSTNVDTSAEYAVDQNLAPVISMSYGGCELANTPDFEAVAQQANAEGITWLVSSGDAGAAGCDRQAVIPQAGTGLAVEFPASIPEITAVGGTEFVEGSGSYWLGSNQPNGNSVLSYIPEKAWNDTATTIDLVATGGGASALFPKPDWQTGPGVPADGARDVPDISLTASGGHDGYLLYTSGSLVVVGGTSLGTPSLAGAVALLNQYLVGNGVLSQPGLGNINPALYRLAQTTTDVFHDVTTGDNIVPCVQSSRDCVNGSLGYQASPGYDQTTGLGSLDVNNLVSEWNNGAANSLSATTLAATPNNAPFNSGAIQLTATVSGGGSPPTGTVSFISNSRTLGIATLASSGTNSKATLMIDSLLIPIGANTVSALYSGNAALSGSTGSTTVTITPVGGSAVVPSISPDPVYKSVTNSSGFSWFSTLTLTEEAGVGTTLTGFTVDGINENLGAFFATPAIPPNGAISSSIGSTAGGDKVFGFTGRDANGVTWSRQLMVPFLTTTLLQPSILLSSTPPTVLQNPAADPSCQWSQQLTVEEQSGFGMQLTKLTAGATDLTSQIQSIFGGTELAAFGRLQGTLCWSGLATPSTKTFTLNATVAENGGTTSAATTASFAAPPASLVTLSASPASIQLTGAAKASASLSLDFSSGSPPWNASVFPANRAASWLTVSPQSGAGSGQVTVTASSAGLSPGVYSALVIVESANTTPQFINVPVRFVVGASSSTQIGGLTNAASYQTVFAPGMILSVFGSQLAPAPQQASSFPLPLTMQGVSATVNGISTPLYFVSPGQLNVQIPYEAGSGPAVLGVNNNGQIASFSFTIAAVAPGIFVGPDNVLVPTPSGKAGDILLAFITGEGDVTPSLETGATPSSSTPVSQLPQPRMPVALTVGGVPATIDFAGIPPALAGVTQINFTIPEGIPPGVQQVVVTVGGVATQAANLTITQ